MIKIIFASFIPIIIYSIARPYLSLSIFIMLIPLSGYLAQGVFVSFIKVYGAILAAVSMPIILNYRITKYKINENIVAYTLFVFMGIISILWADDKSLSKERIMSYLSVYIFYLIIFYLPKSKNNVTHLKYFVIGALASLLFIPFVESTNYYSNMRIAGGGMNANDYACIIAIAACFAVGWFSTEKRFYNRIIPMIFFPLGILGITYTGSRGGTIALLPVIVFILYLYISKKGTKKSVYIIAVVITVALVARYASSNYYERIKNINIHETRGYVNRIELWKAGFNIFKDNWWHGVGIGNFEVHSAVYSEYNILKMKGDPVAHNSFISVAAELGIVGFALYCFLIVNHAKHIINSINNNGENHLFKLSLLMAMLTYVLASMSLTWEYNKSFGLILGSVALITRKGND